MKKKIFLKFLFTVFLFFLFANIGNAYSDADKEKCFDKLLENIDEAGIFPDAVEHFKREKYSAIGTKLSKYYKNSSSFGIDLKKNLFESKIYSFGRDTGYIHPPYSPFPTYSLTDKWEQASKEYIFMEEYIRDADNNKIFLGCGFIQIDSEDLLGVTSDRYLYDGEMLTSLKVNNSYKASYTENISYDHDDEEFVIWRRLFVYPINTVNSYFNKYDVIDLFPANKVSSFNFFENIEDDNQEVVNISLIGDNGNIETSTLPEELFINNSEEDNKFLLLDYYQEIQNQFPLFSEELSLRGIMGFDELKKILTNNSVSKEDEILINNIFDPRNITVYSLNKEIDINEEEKKDNDMILEKISTKDYSYEETVTIIDETKKIETANNEINNNESEENLFIKTKYIYTVILLFLFIAIILLRKKSNKK